MDTRTGKLIASEDLEKIPADEKQFFKPVTRDLTQVEAAKMEIKKYSPCGCGSGKTFKFCCYKPQH